MDPALTDEELRDHIKAMRIHIRNFIICTDQGPDQKAAQAYIDNDVRSQLTCFVWRQWCFQHAAPATEGETPETLPNPNSRKFKWVNRRRITIDLDLDPVIKNDAIVIEDDTDTDTDTTASGDTVVEVVEPCPVH